MKRLELRALAEEELTEVAIGLGLKRFRAGQLFQWVQGKAVQTWDEMKNIPAQERLQLAESLDFHPLERVREQRSQDGTRKYLFRLHDGETIECVLMDYERRHARDRRTVCVSTQVGCAVGCAFCATGLGGFRRNLSVGEIVGQVLDIVCHLRREDPEFNITNVVFMGMGEPLLNYDNLLQAIALLNHPKGQNIGMRRMTISTSGVAPKIRDLARANPQVGLAVSLHAASDELRDALVPMNRRYPLKELLGACREYSELTSRRITFEVALTEDTATRAHAEELAALLKGQLGHVNLIPVNLVAEAGMKRPLQSELKTFAELLEGYGITVTVREERGTDIDAACGQLRRQWEGES